MCLTESKQINLNKLNDYITKYSSLTSIFLINQNFELVLLLRNSNTFLGSLYGSENKSLQNLSSIGNKGI